MFIKKNGNLLGFDLLNGKPVFKVQIASNAVNSVCSYKDGLILASGERRYHFGLDHDSSENDSIEEIKEHKTTENGKITKMRFINQ